MGRVRQLTNGRSSVAHRERLLCGGDFREASVKARPTSDIRRIDLLAAMRSFNIQRKAGVLTLTDGPSRTTWLLGSPPANRSTWCRPRARTGRQTSELPTQPQCAAQALAVKDKPAEGPSSFVLKLGSRLLAHCGGLGGAAIHALWCGQIDRQSASNDHEHRTPGCGR